MRREPARREDVEAYLYRILGRIPRHNETRAFAHTNRDPLEGAPQANDSDTHAEEDTHI